MRLALGQHDRRFGRLLLGLDDLEAGGDGRRGEEAADALGDDVGDGRHRQLAGGRQQPLAVRPLPEFVELADHPWPDLVLPVVEFFLELVFEQLTLFLDDQDFLQPFGEVAHPFRFERPDHAHLVQADADLGGQGFVDAQFVERLADVEIALAGGQDAEARGW